MRISDWSSDVCSSDLMGITASVGIAVSVTGVAFGLALAVLRAVRRPWLSVPIVIFADVMRSLPPLVVIIIFFFAFPLIDLPMSSFTPVWLRSEERRVGKECVRTCKSRWSPLHYKKKKENKTNK